MGHPDTGSEFINWLAKEWFESEKIALTRSEPGKKNDNMYVEERNGHVVRKYLGYERIDVKECIEVLNVMYQKLELYVNHFIPVRRTMEKKRVGAKYMRTYEKVARTPYQRLMEHPDIAADLKTKIKAQHETLHPLRLKKEIDAMVTTIMNVNRRGKKPK
jgi:hypothetical protein